MKNKKTHAVIDLVLSSDKNEVIDFVGTLQECEEHIEGEEAWSYKIIQLSQEEIKTLQ